MPAIIFDFDGVVCDSEPLHERALREVAEPAGLGFSPETFRERFIGQGETACFRLMGELNGRTVTDDEIETLSARKIEVFTRILAEGPVPTHAGAVELIRAASDAGPLGLCSGSRRAEVEPILRRLEVFDLFGVTITADDVVETKPDPTGYRLACASLGVEATEAVAIEDSPTGLAAAWGAGLARAAVCHSYPRDRLDADLVVERIAELDVERLHAAIGARSVSDG